MTRVCSDTGSSAKSRPSLSGVWSKLRFVYREIAQRRAMRRGLGKASDPDLQDVGLLRHDIEILSSLSVFVDATMKLHDQRNDRSTNW